MEASEGEEKFPHNGSKFQALSTQWKRVLPVFSGVWESRGRPTYGGMGAHMAGSGGWHCNRGRGGV